MAQKDNILQELAELKSRLAGITAQNAYTVPGGYFEELPGQILKRIKAMEAANTIEELNYLSPLLNTITKKMPFSVPQDYFSQVQEKLIELVRESSKYQTAKEELETLSPLLGGLKKQMPFSVPEGYFESLGEKISAEENKPAAKVISFSTRKWFRYAAAAVITGIIALGSFLVVDMDKADPTENSHAWVKKNVKKVSTDKLDEFIQLVEEEKPVENAVVSIDKAKEVKELIKDVPETEIQSLLNDIQILEEPASEEPILN